MNFAERDTASEFMDDPGFSGADLRESLAFIRLVNLLGGGQRAVLSGLARVLRGWPRERPVEILDVGCGLGDIGRAISRWGKARRFRLSYLGLDRSEPTLALARAWSHGADCRFLQGDLFDAGIPEADVVIASMTLHHFGKDEVCRAISHLVGKARHALVINDLERSWVSYAVCSFLTLFLESDRSRQDALLSIRKGFTIEEMHSFLLQAGGPGFVRKALGWRLLAIVPGTAPMVAPRT